LLTDVTERVVDRSDAATRVYPGHGADTTLGAERPHLDEWRDRGWWRTARAPLGTPR
jgi:glyoxylase-like metal-dependent hydrolase (beta-lactamase superfamily II)